MLKTKHLTLINCDLPTTQAVLRGDVDLADHLKVNVPENWTEFGAPAFEMTQKALLSSPDLAQWYAYLPILTSENTLVGSCGYVGVPKDGVVEIGYEIAAGYRKRGLGTEVAEALTQNALKQKDVKMVIAHTLPKESGSTRILKSCGFKRVGTVQSEEDGPVWLWQRKRKFWEILAFQHSSIPAF